MGLSRDQILSADDIKPFLTVAVVPEWGGEVYLRPLSGKDRERFENAVSSPTPSKPLRALLASMTLCDEQGRLLFGESDVDALAQKSSKALHQVWEVATVANKLSKKGVEDAEKNSDPASSGATPSVSLDNSGATIRTFS